MTDLIIFGLIVLALVFGFVIGVEGTTPFFSRTEFDMICSNFLKETMIEKGLDDTSKQELIQELKNEGFEDVKVVAPDSLEWGQEFEFKVEASLKLKETKDYSGAKEIKTRVFVFEENAKAMGLEN